MLWSQPGDGPRLLWSFSGCAHQSNNLRVHRLAGTSDGVVLVKCGYGHFRFLDDETGCERWSWQPTWISHAEDRLDLAVDEMGTSIATAIVDGDLLARNMQTGAPRWKVSTPTWAQKISRPRYVGTANVRKNCLAIYFSDDAQRVIGIDSHTGRLLWSVDLSVNGAVIQLEDVVYVADEHVLSCIDPVTGKDRWTTQVDGHAYFGLGITQVAGVVTVLSAKSETWYVTGLDEVSGSRLWVTGLETEVELQSPSPGILVLYNSSPIDSP